LKKKICQGRDQDELPQQDIKKHHPGLVRPAVPDHKRHLIVDNQKGYIQKQQAQKKHQGEIYKQFEL
jgi:hypothetical protein